MAWKESETAKLKESSKSAGSSYIYTLGPLIHNPAVLETLEKRGLSCLKEDDIPPEPENSTVIIRAHGVSPSVETKFTKMGVRVLDATCPHVKESQNKAFSYAKKGYKVFLAGEKDHGEIAGIRGYAESGSPSACFVVCSPEEAEASAAKLSGNPKANAVLIGQTTFGFSGYKAIEEAIKKYIPGLVTVNSICGATAERQKALKELCGKVDAVIIAGGRDSSNTRRLLELALELGKPAWLVETPGDLPSEINAFETVGLSAGASTPDEVIDEIEKKLSGFF